MDYYSTNKLIRDFGLPLEQIDDDDIDLDYYKFCGEAKYKQTRKRNSNCKKTPYAILRSDCQANDVAANHQTEDGSMCHPPDVKAWRHFDQIYLNFAAEPRNFRPSLCGWVHTKWAVQSYIFMLARYTHTVQSPIENVHEYMFLKMVIPSSSNPKCLIDAYLEPLIEEL
ncbi:UNVERIFIED_CONTAM: hypothetical protein Sindi_0967400 [Sesamum indicum]